MNIPLSTTPNASIPYSFRKRAPNGDEKLTAAGILFVAPDGRALFTRRSGADHAGEWAFPGGVVEQDEEPHEAARREALEEIGRLPGWELSPLDRNTNDEGVDFVTFGMPTDAFVPRLNGEHDSHVWAPLEAPPEPTHPAVRAMLGRLLAGDVGVHQPLIKGETNGDYGSPPAEARAKAADTDANALEDGKRQVKSIKGKIDPDSGELEKFKIKFETGGEDQKASHEESEYGTSTGEDRCDGCRHYITAGPHCELVEDPIAPDGWCKFFAACERTATDSALVIAMDRESVRTIDPDGRLRVASAHISKANICPYRGEEIPGCEELGLDPNKVYQLLRHPDELAKAASSFNGVQLLRKHVPVNAEDHRAYDVVGTTGTEATWNDPYLDNSLVVWAKDAIDDIESEEKRELSCGYHYRADMTPGIYDGKEYDGVMRDIVGNHVALVEMGRAGSDVIVGDSMESLMASPALPTRFAKLALDQTLLVLPKLAKDAKFDLLPIFAPLTPKNFKAKDVRLALDKALKGKLAKDATMDDVTSMLDKLEHQTEQPKSLDESVSGPQHRAMAAAAKGESNLDIPKNVGQEFLDKDKGKTFSDQAETVGKMPYASKGDADADPSENLGNFLKSKGMSEDDVRTACDMVYKKAVAAEVPGTDQGKGMESPGSKESDTEDPAKNLKSGDEGTQSLERIEKPDTSGAKDMGAKDQAMVTKSAMDAAIKTATEQTAKAVRESVLKTQREIRMALDEVRPFVGELRNDLAFDSAEDVYREALKIKDPEFKLDDVHPSAFRPILTKGYARAGARETNDGSRQRLGMDASMAESMKALEKQLDDPFANIARIGAA